MRGYEQFLPQVIESGWAEVLGGEFFLYFFPERCTVAHSTARGININLNVT